MEQTEGEEFKVQEPQPGARGEDDATQRPRSIQKSLRSRWPTSFSKENYLLFNLKVWAAIMQIITFTLPFQTHIKVCFALKDYESKKIDTFPSWVDVGQRDAADDMGRCDNPCNELILQRGARRAQLATRTYTSAGGWSMQALLFPQVCRPRKLDLDWKGTLSLPASPSFQRDLL